MCHPSSTQYTHAQLSGQILMFRIISCRFDLFLIPTRATNWKYVRFCRTIVSKGIFVSMDQMDKVDIAQKHSQQNKLNGGLTSFTGKCTLGLIRCCKFDPFFWQLNGFIVSLLLGFVLNNSVECQFTFSPLTVSQNEKKGLDYFFWT